MPEGASGRSAIERCVGDGAAFAREVWGQRARHYPAADPSAFGDVLSLQDVDALIGTGGLRHPALRLVRDGQTEPRSSFVTAHTTGGRRVTDAIDAEAVLGAFAEGATLVLQGLHRFVLPVQRFCAELERFFDHPLQANAYLTPAGARGLATHHDTHDVLVLQLLGRKRWLLHAPEVDRPVAGYPADKLHAEPGDPEQTLRLEAGDCLYLPRGVPHRAEGLEGASLHLTLGIRSPTWLDVLGRVMKRARELPELRASLPLGYTTHPGELEAGLAETLERTASWLRGLDPAELTAAEIERAREARSPEQVGRLAALAQDRDMAVDEDTPLRRTDDGPWHLQLEGDHATLHAAGAVVRFPARIEPALRAVCELTHLRARDLTEHLDPRSALVMVRRLHREGLLGRGDGS